MTSTPAEPADFDDQVQDGQDPGECLVPGAENDVPHEPAPSELDHVEPADVPSVDEDGVLR